MVPGGNLIPALHFSFFSIKINITVNLSASYWNRKNNLINIYNGSSFERIFDKATKYQHLTQ